MEIRERCAKEAENYCKDKMKRTTAVFDFATRWVGYKDISKSYHDFIAGWEAAMRFRDAELLEENSYAALDVATTMTCDHSWVDARNVNVASGEICMNCGAIRAGNKL